jgi:hypothetical protein
MAQFNQGETGRNDFWSDFRNKIHTVGFCVLWPKDQIDSASLPAIWLLLLRRTSPSGSSTSSFLSSGQLLPSRAMGPQISVMRYGFLIERRSLLWVVFTTCGWYPPALFGFDVLICEEQRLILLNQFVLLQESMCNV